jgi:hypothetical protein
MTYRNVVSAVVRALAAETINSAGGCDFEPKVQCAKQKGEIVGKEAAFLQDCWVFGRLHKSLTPSALAGAGGEVLNPYRPQACSDRGADSRDAFACAGAVPALRCGYLGNASVARRGREALHQRPTGRLVRDGQLVKRTASD